MTAKTAPKLRPAIVASVRIADLYMSTLYHTLSNKARL